jgi:hypothetical protein
MRLRSARDGPSGSAGVFLRRPARWRDAIALTPAKRTRSCARHRARLRRELVSVHQGERPAAREPRSPRATFLAVPASLRGPLTSVFDRALLFGRLLPTSGWPVAIRCGHVDRVSQPVDDAHVAWLVHAPCNRCIPFLLAGNI